MFCCLINLNNSAITIYWCIVSLLLQNVTYDTLFINRHACTGEARYLEMTPRYWYIAVFDGFSVIVVQNSKITVYCSHVASAICGKIKST